MSLYSLLFKTSPDMLLCPNRDRTHDHGYRTTFHEVGSKRVLRGYKPVCSLLKGTTTSRKPMPSVLALTVLQPQLILKPYQWSFGTDNEKGKKKNPSLACRGIDLVYGFKQKMNTSCAITSHVSGCKTNLWKILPKASKHLWEVQLLAILYRMRGSLIYQQWGMAWSETWDKKR